MAMMRSTKAGKSVKRLPEKKEISPVACHLLSKAGMSEDNLQALTALLKK